MDRIAYFREPVDCPECGLPTNYLQEVTETYITSKGKITEKTVMCEDCIEVETE